MVIGYLHASSKDHERLKIVEFIDVDLFVFAILFESQVWSFIIRKF